MKLLLKSKYPTNITKTNNITALGIACCKKELLSIAKLLIEKGSDINWTTNDGMGALYHAIKHDNY